MAPPTILYNNANAKYTNYEQPDKNKILETEVALAKSFLTMNIETFNTNAPSGNMDINYSLVTPGTSNTQPLTHLMLNQQMNDLGSVFAFAAEHNFDNTNGITDESAHLSFDTTSGYTGNGLSTEITGAVSVTDDSAAYYDATTGFATDNTENTFQDNEDNTVTRYTVTYDQTSAGNFNAEKAVSSRYSSFITDICNNIIATPDTTKNDALQIFENTVFNESDSLYTEMRVLRDTTTNILSVDPSNITYGMTSLTNTSGQYYYSGNTVFGDGYIGVPDDIVDPSNERAFFGSLRFTQTSEDVIDISGNAAGSNSTTLCMVPSDQGSSLPTSMTKSDFDDLFTSAELPYVGQDYNLNIREYLYGIADPSNVIGDGIDGGYYTNGTVGSGPFRGFDTDDTSVKRNTTYMRKCAEEGQDFSQSVQTVEIVNGDLIATRAFTGPNADLLINRVDASGSDVNGNPTPHDTDETLALTEYQNDYWVKTYFTEPSTSVSATYHRAEESEGNSSTYTDFRVIYETIEDASSSILPNDRRSRYYDNFDITTIFPNTSVQGAEFSGSKYVGINQGFAAVFQEYVDGSGATIVKNGINLNSDYTFTSSAAAASKIADNEIAILHLNNTMLMSNENTMFTDATTSTGIPGTTASVLGTSINLINFTNTLDNTTSDLRVKFDIKGANGPASNVPYMMSTLSNGFTIRRLVSNYFTLNSFASTTNMFGAKIYDIMANPNTTVPMTITMTTNGNSQHRDGLTIGAVVNWTLDGVSTNYVIPEVVQVNITNSNVAPTGEIENLVKDVHYKLTTFASNNTLIASKLSKASLKGRFETRGFIPQFSLPIGSYTNFGVRGVPMFMVTKYFVLEDVCGNKLPDSYLNYLEGLNGVSLLSTRIIRDVATKASTVVAFSAKDLYGATAAIQALDGSNNWVNVSPSMDFDPVFNNTTTFTLNDGAGTITATTDITNNANPTSTNAITLGGATQSYYIGLTTDNISYSVVGKKWDVNSLVDAEAITSWAESESIYSTSFPTDGTTIDGLVAYTTYISPESSNFTTQPDLTLTVIDASGSIWAKFVTDSKNITSDFNILFARRPVFHIVETYKDVNITVDADGASWIQDPSNTVVDTYKMAGTSTQLQVIDGIKLTFLSDTGITDSASYRLLGDNLEASLYNGYAGPYSTLSEVTFANGLVIADSIARGIDIKYYRGNSVRTAVSPATYEEFRWTRSVTQIYMKIVNTNASSVSLTYTDTPTDLYDGSIHTVTNLSGSIGDLGLKFYGNLSRFRNVNTSYTSQDLVMNQPITILFDAYIWSITNPYNTTADGQVNALQDSSGVVFTNEYSIVNYTGSNPMNIVAGRVWIRNPNGNSGVEEFFNLYYELPTVKVDYLSEQYVGNPSTFNWANANRIDEISFADLNVGRYVKTPSTIAGGVKDSHFYIKIAPIMHQDYVGYSLLPRPQIIVETIATKDVSTVPFNYNVPTRTFRGIDIVYETNSHYPFAGGFGTNNGTIGGYRVVNNMEVVFNNNELYYDLRFDADSVTDKRRKIYIPSNKIKLELYKGYGHTTLVEGLKIGIIYEGYIHKLKNYDVDAFPNVNIYQDLCGNVIDSNTYNNYDGTFLDGQQNSDLTYDLAFSQDTSVISPLISSGDIYGQLAGKVVNIELQGISAFMDLTGVAVIDRHLDLLTGDSVKLNLYGHTFNTDVSNNLVVEFVKYTTDTGYDFSTNAAEIFIKNLGFNASTRETATVILKTPSSVLTAIPYNFVNVCNTLAADTSFNSLTWVTDTEWAGRSIQDKQLAFNMVCLSTVGQAKLTSILGVSTRSPWRMLVSQYPNKLDLRSGDGSPIYGVDSFGKLTNLTTSTQVVLLKPQTVGSSDNDVQEYGAYNVLLGNSI